MTRRSLFQTLAAAIGAAKAQPLLAERSPTDLNPRICGTLTVVRDPLRRTYSAHYTHASYSMGWQVCDIDVVRMSDRELQNVARRLGEHIRREEERLICEEFSKNSRR